MINNVNKTVLKKSIKDINLKKEKREGKNKLNETKVVNTNYRKIKRDAIKNFQKKRWNYRH